MAGNPSKDVMRQPLPTGGDQSAVQNIINQSFDPTFRTLIVQIMGRDATGTNLYPLQTTSAGALTVGGSVTVASGSVALAPSASSNSLTVYSNGALTNVPVQIKAGTARWHKVYAYNANTALVYLQVFNALEASVVLGTTAPTNSFPILPNAIWDDFWLYADGYATGLTIAVTTTRTGNIAPTTPLDINMGYL